MNDLVKALENFLGKEGHSGSFGVQKGVGDAEGSLLLTLQSYDYGSCTLKVANDGTASLLAETPKKERSGEDELNSDEPASLAD